MYAFDEWLNMLYALHTHIVCDGMAAVITDAAAAVVIWFVVTVCWCSLQFIYNYTHKHRHNKKEA